MNGTTRMTRTLLAVLGMIAAAVSSSCGAPIVTRRGVANGAEVVLELVEGGEHTQFLEFWQYSYRTPTGLNWVFYREPACLMQEPPFEDVIEEILQEEVQNGHLEFNDRRVCLFLPDGDGCIIVTLDLPPAVPRVQVDTFYHVHGFGSRHARLRSVDALELSDDHAPLLKTHLFTRDPDGTWRLEGAPYETHLRTQVSAVPLPFVQKVKRNDPVVIDPRRADRNQRYRAAIRLLKLPSATANLELPWGMVAAGSSVPDLPPLMATQNRLQDILDGLSEHWPVQPGAEIGMDLEVPSMRFARIDDQFQIQIQI